MIRSLGNPFIFQPWQKRRGGLARGMREGEVQGREEEAAAAVRAAVGLVADDGAAEDLGAVAPELVRPPSDRPELEPGLKDTVPERPYHSNLCTSEFH